MTSKANLITLLENSLGASFSGVVVDNGGWDFYFLIAAKEMADIVPRRKAGTLTLVAGQSDYATPSDYLYFSASEWGIAELDKIQPWDDSYPGVLPTVSEVVAADDSKKLRLSPCPDSADLVRNGSTYAYTYRATHTLNDSVCTVAEKDEHILLMVLQKHALLFMAKRNSDKQVTMGDGYSNGPRNGTPAALAEQTQDQIDRAIMARAT